MLLKSLYRFIGSSTFLSCHIAFIADNQIACCWNLVTLRVVRTWRNSYIFNEVQGVLYSGILKWLYLNFSVTLHLVQTVKFLVALWVMADHTACVFLHRCAHCLCALLSSHFNCLRHVTFLPLHIMRSHLKCQLSAEKACYVSRVIFQSN